MKLSVVLVAAVVFGNAQTAVHVEAQTQTPNQAVAEAPPYELNGGDLQAAGFGLSSQTPTVRDLARYEESLPTHQEFLIDWDPHTGYDHPVYREQVAERSLKHEFALMQRKQKVGGGSEMRVLMLFDLGLEVVAVTRNGEVRGIANGGELLIRAECLAIPPAQGDKPVAPPVVPSECHDYIQGKGAFRVSLPDDPEIERLILLLAHPNEKPRLEKVGMIDLTSKAAPR